jgi:hypothetical protein
VIPYRLRQFRRALLGRIRPDEHALAAALLSPRELRLYNALPRHARRHALDVYGRLRAAGQHNPALLRAALLHDCGKVDDADRPIPLLYYGAFVLLRRLWPALYQAAAASGRGPLRFFRVHAEHELRSARRAEAAGSPPEVVAIIRGYQHAPPGSAGAWLRWADDHS